MLSLDTNGIFHELTLVYKCVYLFLPLASLSVQLEGSVQETTVRIDKAIFSEAYNVKN
jgi:hypothetical protein